MARDFGAKEDVVEVYGRIFPSYSRLGMHPAISKRLKDIPGGKLLDFPTGSGSFAWRLQNKGFI